MQPSSPEFLSCDWGTTSFRLRLVCRTTGVVLRSLSEPAGVKSLHISAAEPGVNRDDVFAGFLRAKVNELIGADKKRSLPLLISGMASSTIGWKELPYATVPFPLDGSGARVERLDWDAPAQVSATHLVSGVATGTDMMRGEETEVLGLLGNAELSRCRERSLLILPGTHSKHVSIENAAVVGLRTFMTGELFEVLRQHSILRASVQQSGAEAGNTVEAVDLDAFREGVTWQSRHGLAGSLFRVRTRAVLEYKNPQQNLSFLSGVLIGSEMAAIAPDAPVLIAATGKLALFYDAACGLVRHSAFQVLPPQLVEQAIPVAHALLLQHLESSS